MNTDLIESLERLKQLNEYPIFYLNDFFTDLRSQVDESFVKKKLELLSKFNSCEDDTYKQLNDNWCKMINRINEFETVCIQHNRINQMISDLNQNIENNIEKIQYIILNYQNENINDDIGYLISDTIFQIKQKIFNNKTIYLLRRDKCILSRMLSGLNYKTQIGKLIIIDNEYIDSSTLNMLNEFNNRNKIKRLTNELIKCKHLKEHLESFVIAESDEQIMEFLIDFSKLNRLNGYSNREIESLGSDLFKSLNQLNELYLRENQIKSLNFQSFNNESNGLLNLKLLDLSCNQIVRLESGIISQLVNLVYFDASFNEIEYLDKDLFKKTTKLKVINLRNNFLNSLDRGLFKYLDQLEYIDLADNHIKNKDYFLIGLNEKCKVNFNSDSFYLIYEFSLRNYVNSGNSEII